MLVLEGPNGPMLWLFHSSGTRMIRIFRSTSRCKFVNEEYEYLASVPEFYEKAMSNLGNWEKVGPNKLLSILLGVEQC